MAFGGILSMLIAFFPIFSHLHLAMIGDVVQWEKTLIRSHEM